MADVFLIAFSLGLSRRLFDPLIFATFFFCEQLKKLLLCLALQDEEDDEDFDFGTASGDVSLLRLF